MFSMTPEEQREASRLAEQVAEFLTRLQALGTVGVTPGRIVTIAGTIRKIGTRWAVDNGR